jgi:hypothetical protein
MEAVLAKRGIIFEGAADLTLMPCSAKGTVSSATAQWLERYSIPHPNKIQSRIQLGDVTLPVTFPGPKSITRYVSFAASVLNDASSAETINLIGRKAGDITARMPDLRIVETPLLGTGAGGLGTVEAGKALATRFRETRNNNSTLFIFVYDAERLAMLDKAIKGGVLNRVKESIMINPNFAGLGINLKKLFGYEKQRYVDDRNQAGRGPQSLRSELTFGRGLLSDPATGLPN